MRAIGRGEEPQRLNLNGVTDLPAGKLATVATYLEMRYPPARAAAETPMPPAGWAFEPLARDPARYRALYTAVGQRWLWFSRLFLTPERLGAILASPNIEALALKADGRDIGLIELDHRLAGECALSFLGLVPDAIGQGWGQILIAEAIRRAFARPIGRLWVHTCTLDHPGALPFYIQAGFRPYKRAIEIADDPRLTGHLPPDAAPQFPPV